ncbi:MAPK kinase substrate protein At1g80180-like [Prunus avium]|uniref:MAPK kinase substrate protein At1g80180-like n=1 Tax=Prunus avium TaxID=42229 RepID=A0A6P5RM77_PRUAV|nr:MAPK kinase substrate protein At1g80180-like [Prunus avium]
MAGLQRSSVSFRRQGSSGFVWDDKHLSRELVDKVAPLLKEERGRARQDQEKAEIIEGVRAPKPINTVSRSRSNGGGRGYRTGKVTPAIEPPSPKVSVCGFCGGFGKPSRKSINLRARACLIDFDWLRVRYKYGVLQEISIMYEGN